MDAQQPHAMAATTRPQAIGAYAVASQPAATKAMTLPVTWSGSPWSLTGLSFLNFALTIVTLGIYGFWGRTEVRKRIWSSVRLAGEPLEYTGTGKELFLGFLFVLGVVFIPLFLVAAGSQFAFGPKSPWTLGVQGILYAAGFYLVGVAMYRARRYRLSRTNWRGIRGSLVGNSWGYGWTSFWTLLLIPAVLLAAAILARVVTGPSIVGKTAGMMAAKPFLAGGIMLVPLIVWLWLVPWRATKLYRHITDDMTFGDQPFAFVGSARPLYARFIARWIGVVILAIGTVGAMFAVGLFDLFKEMAQTAQLPAGRKRQPTGPEIAWLIGILLSASFLYSIITAWYRAAQANIFAAATRFEGVSLQLAVTAGGLIWVFVTNYLLTTFSIGILKPVAEARTARYFVERFGFVGPIDIERIAQSQAALGKTGEGLAQAFDVDAF